MSHPFQTIYCPWDYLLIFFCFPAKHVSIASDIWWLARARQWFNDLTGQRAENEKEGHGEFVLFISAHREQDEQCSVQKRSEDSDHTFHPINHVNQTFDDDISSCLNKDEMSFSAFIMMASFCHVSPNPRPEHKQALTFT